MKKWAKVKTGDRGDSLSLLLELPEPQSKPGQMKLSKGQSQPYTAADIRLLNF